MKYIVVPESERESANQTIVDHVDKNGGDTFMVNFQTEMGDGVCIIVVPSNSDILNYFAGVNNISQYKQKEQ